MYQNQLIMELQGTKMLSHCWKVLFTTPLTFGSTGVQIQGTVNMYCYRLVSIMFRCCLRQVSLCGGLATTTKNEPNMWVKFKSNNLQSGPSAILIYLLFIYRLHTYTFTISVLVRFFKINHDKKMHVN